jgi:hypothetical protein
MRRRDDTPGHFKRPIRFRWGDSVEIREGPTKELGHWDPKKGEIVIRPNQPEPGKHVVLMHELLHMVDDLLVQQGITKRRMPHDWITHAAPNLVGLLAAAGLYRGVTPRQFQRFVRSRRTP